VGDLVDHAVIQELKGVGLVVTRRLRIFHLRCERSNVSAAAEYCFEVGPLKCVPAVIVRVQDGTPLDEICKLTYFTRPVVARDAALSFRRERDRVCLVLAGVPVREVPDERRGVLDSLAQGRSSNLQDSESVVQVFAHGAVFELGGVPGLLLRAP